jgi:glycosyltransferase involved in cell wall biosynthesis
LTKVKGVDVLLLSMPPVLRSWPDAELVIVGDGRQRGNLTALTQSLGIDNNVKFRGEIRDESSLFLEYARSTVFVLPSFSEAFSLVLAEALAFELPIVATSTIGARSIIEDGYSGILVNPGSHEEIAKALVWTLGHMEVAREMARRGHSAIERRFNLSRVVSDYEGVLLASKRGF